jgi:hypothetical protein
MLRNSSHSPVNTLGAVRSSSRHHHHHHHMCIHSHTIVALRSIIAANVRQASELFIAVFTFWTEPRHVSLGPAKSQGQRVCPTQIPCSIVWPFGHTLF